MSDSKQSQEKWRAEELRAQRKARLARMKSKDGGKKPLRTTNKLAVVITVVILVIALALVGVWYAIRIGIPQRNLTAVTIGSEEIKPVELNYYYYSLLSQYSIDPKTTEGQTTLKSASGDAKFPTVAELLKDQAAQQAQQDVMLATNAVQAGLALDDTDREQIATYMTSLQNSALQASATLDNFLTSQYGVGMTKASLQSIIERLLLANKFASQKQKSLSFTTDEIKAYYDTHKDDYDVVKYRSFYLAAETKTGATDAEKTKFLEAARTKANEMLAKVTDETTFKAQCIAYAAEADKASYTTSDPSLKNNTKKADLAKDQADWLFTAERKAGDKTVIESTSGYYILYYLERSRPDYSLVDVRHILISAAKETATADEIAAAKAKAESILAGYKAGAQTEDAFAALAAANSADTGSSSNGGLYSNVAPGQMVPEFDAWCFDASRKAGDTGIVQTDFGFHIMYFVKFGGVEWEVSVSSVLRSEAYTKYLQEEVKKFPYTADSLGMRFVG